MLSNGGRRDHFQTTLLASFLCLLFSSCGLPTYIYLYSPADFSASANQLSLTNNSNNYDSSEGLTQSFKGYELFYRAYSSQTSADTMSTALINKASIYSSDPDSFMSYANSAGFFRVRLLGSDGAPTDSTPLLSISAAKAQSDDTYYFNLEPNSDWLLSDGTTSQTICRSVADSTRCGFYKKANFLASSGDADYTGTDSPSTLYFVFFAVAFGTDSSTPWMTVYSAPSLLSGGVVPYTPGS